MATKKRTAFGPTQDVPELIGLGDATDALNVSLTKAERALQKLNWGIEACVSFDSGYDNEAEVSWSFNLAFRKVGNAWRLMYEYSDSHEDETAVEITRASREIRIQASGALQALFDEILKIKTARLAEVLAAKSSVDSFVAELTARYLPEGDDT